MSKIFKADEPMPKLVSLKECCEDYEQTLGANLKVFELKKENGKPLSQKMRTSGKSNPLNRARRSRNKRAGSQHDEDLLQKAEQIERGAYEKGFAQGEKAGLQLGEQKLDVVLRQAEELVTNFGKLREELFEAEKAKLVHLAVLIAEKILHHEVDRREDVVMNIAQAAIQKTISSDRITIHLNPADIDLFNEMSRSLPEIAERSENITVNADSNIQRGGCVVTTKNGEIDATLDNQLYMMKSEMLEE